MKVASAWARHLDADVVETAEMFFRLDVIDVNLFFAYWAKKRMFLYMSPTMFHCILHLLLTIGASEVGLAIRHSFFKLPKFYLGEETLRACERGYIYS